MKTIVICLLGIAVGAGAVLWLAICQIAAGKPPVHPDDRKEFDDHDV